MITVRRIAMSKKPISNQWVASVTADLSSAYQRCNEAWRAILDYQTSLAAGSIEVYADVRAQYERELYRLEHCMQQIRLAQQEIGISNSEGAGSG
jgi:hypothetical protein